MKRSRWTNQLPFFVVLLASVLVAAFPGSSRAGSYIFYPTDDSYVIDYLPNASNQATSGTVQAKAERVGYPSTWVGDPEIQRIYIKFDLTSIPVGEIVTNGILNLLEYSIDPNNVELDMYATPTNWTETTLTWNNQPGFGSKITSFITTRKTWARIALPALALADPLISFGLKLTDETIDTGDGDIYYFREASYYSKQFSDQTKRPYLAVETSIAVIPLPGAAWLLFTGLISLFMLRPGRK
jgi:hypothetical protein